MSEIIIVTRAMGQTVSGQVVVFREGFSPRYDLDRTSGVISRRGHSAEGQSIKDKILVIPTAKGGVAGGWAFRDLVCKGFAPVHSFSASLIPSWSRERCSRASPLPKAGSRTP